MDNECTTLLPWNIKKSDTNHTTMKSVLLTWFLVKPIFLASSDSLPTQVKKVSFSFIQPKLSSPFNFSMILVLESPLFDLHYVCSIFMPAQIIRMNDDHNCSRNTIILSMKDMQPQINIAHCSCEYLVLFTL